MKLEDANKFWDKVQKVWLLTESTLNNMLEDSEKDTEHFNKFRSELFKIMLEDE